MEARRGPTGRAADEVKHEAERDAGGGFLHARQGRSPLRAQGQEWLLGGSPKAFLPCMEALAARQSDDARA